MASVAKTTNTVCSHVMEELQYSWNIDLLKIVDLNQS